MDPSYKGYEIAYYIGYDSPKNFTRAFKSYFHVTPRDYRNGVRKEECWYDAKKIFFKEDQNLFSYYDYSDFAIVYYFGLPVDFRSAETDQGRGEEFFKQFQW